MKPELTMAQAKTVTRKVSFSLYSRVERLIAAYPSVSFRCNCQSNGGVTTDYTLTGPTVWVDKIERKYSY